MHEVVDPLRPTGSSRRVAGVAAARAAARAGGDAGAAAAAAAAAARRGLVSVHGLRYCHQCGAVKARDDNAAICIHDVGVHEFNHGERPLAFVSIDQLTGDALAARQQAKATAAVRHVLR